MKIQLIKKGISYYPAFDEDLELSKKVAQGSIITGATERPRN
jgi:hypothetical protein